MSQTANEHRGEVAFEISEEFKFAARPDFTLIATIEAQFGSILLLAQKSRMMQLSATECVGITAIAARAADDKIAKPYKDELAFRSAIYSAGKMTKLVAPVTALISAALDDGKPEKNAPAAKSKK